MKHESLDISVVYPAAAHPFTQQHAPRAETLATLKTAVLAKFDLHEGPQPDGQTATYTLYLKKQPLENLSETVGQLAGDEDKLHLKLSQQLTQG